MKLVNLKMKNEPIDPYVSVFKQIDNETLVLEWGNAKIRISKNGSIEFINKVSSFHLNDSGDICLDAGNHIYLNR